MDDTGKCAIDSDSLPLRNDYPRPSMKRDFATFINLNGIWDFDFDFEKTGKSSGKEKKDAAFSKKINVPYAPESRFSGIEYTDFIPAVWYRRTFSVDTDSLDEKRLLLHFGAVDNYAEIYINGKKAGYHRGGYTPFTVDITGLIEEGENYITVYAEDDTENPMIPSGKQSPRKENYNCFYTRCTGIWQSVWLETVPETYIKSVKITPDVPNEKIDVSVITEGQSNAFHLFATASYDSEPVAETALFAAGNLVSFSLPVKNPVLWEPGNGRLYNLNLTFGDDSVDCSFGMRSVAIEGKKFLINGKSVFQRLVLDQGYYPGGVYTAGGEKDFEDDIKRAMDMGFNGARMHEKVFEPGYIAAADRLGFLVWGEFPNWGLDVTRDGAFDVTAPAWREEIERDISAPSIIGWCPLNEVWTPDAAEYIENLYRLTKTLDPSRPAIDISGFMHSRFTDIYDVHDYEQNVEEFSRHYEPLATGIGEAFINYPEHETRNPALPYFVSEFGGTFRDAKSNDSGKDQNNAWGYGDAPEDDEEFYARLEGLCSVLLSNPSICGFCYTQLYDVMQEKNGLYTYRREPKFSAGRIKDIVSRTAEIEKQ